jgi:hypothetical protein
MNHHEHEINNSLLKTLLPHFGARQLDTMAGEVIHQSQIGHQILSK